MQTLRTPKLVPDDTEPIWSITAQNIPLKNLKQSILGSLSGLSIYREDPRVGPFLLLGALISLGTIWLRRSQQQVQPSEQNQPNSNQPSESNQPTQPSSKVTFAVICYLAFFQTRSYLYIFILTDVFTG